VSSRTGQHRADFLLVVSLSSLPFPSPAPLLSYTPENAPDKSEQGQSGTNQCGTGSDPNSMCQNAFINSATDFCLWAPPSTTSDEGDGTSKIGNTERVEVAWCTKGGRGTRVIPEGAVRSIVSPPFRGMLTFRSMPFPIRSLERTSSRLLITVSFLFARRLL
jgi:hypothetical protein